MATDDHEVQTTVQLPRKPSPDLVRMVSRGFRQSYAISERAVEEIFRSYPLNSDPSAVLLKSVVLNTLYSAGVLAIYHMAEHIHSLHEEIDAALASGGPEIVHRIERLPVPRRMKPVFCYSFATKYCNWHQPERYPIYDERVRRYLTTLKKHGEFNSAAFQTQKSLWHYPTFLRIMTDFKEQFDLGQLSFKEIDEFIWTAAEPLMPLRKWDGRGQQ